jgi:hypothetical protein
MPLIPGSALRALVPMLRRPTALVPVLGRPTAVMPWGDRIVGYVYHWRGSQTPQRFLRLLPDGSQMFDDCQIHDPGHVALVKTDGRYLSITWERGAKALATGPAFPDRMKVKPGRPLPQLPEDPEERAAATEIWRNESLSLEGSQLDPLPGVPRATTTYVNTSRNVVKPAKARTLREDVDQRGDPDEIQPIYERDFDPTKLGAGIDRRVANPGTFGLQAQGKYEASHCVTNVEGVLDEARQPGVPPIRAGARSSTEGFAEKLRAAVGRGRPPGPPRVGSAARGAGGAAEATEASEAATASTAAEAAETGGAAIAADVGEAALALLVL